ncbi:hypothetical protein, partial [Streptomyces fulvoviolaceus]|uniref:hypothetical protein n=1 Tax=Streptomyces fulvoviolaceus TaxID=285535 RepID=UPI0036F3A456|nr:hypothetical protein [Streptomyces fulvoviolaceus]
MLTTSTDEPPLDIVPVVERDEEQRQWISRQVVEGDLPDDLSGLGISDPDGLYDFNDPVTQVRTVMVGSDTWSKELHAVAARATRRIWNEEYAAFAGGVPDADPEATRRAWDTAVPLVMPLELHPVLADSRHAGGEFRDAVRDVARLLAAGGTRNEARARADRHRHDLGLRGKGRGGVPRTITAPAGSSAESSHAPPTTPVFAPPPGDGTRTPDTARDPFGQRLPIGRPVTLDGPRRGGLTEVPAADAPPSPSAGKGKQPERWFTYRRTTPYSQVPEYTYQVSTGGEIDLPADGDTPTVTLPPEGWLRFGDDFVQVPTADAPDGAFLRGDSGWLGTLADPDALRDRMNAPGSAPVPYTLVVDPAGTHLYLVPTGADEAAGAEGDSAVRIPLEGTAPDRTPWYLSHDAMGQAIVADSVKDLKFTRPWADLWAEQISQGLVLPDPGPGRSLDGLRAGIRDAIADLLVTKKASDWDDVLSVGRTVVVDGRLVWLRPMLRDLTFVPPVEGDGVKDYPVGFGSTQTGGETSKETIRGFSTLLFTGLNLGAKVAATVAGVAAPQVDISSAKTKASGWSRTVLSGRKPFINDFNLFTAGLEMRVFVGGEEVTPPGRRVTVPDRLPVRLPGPYSSEDGHRPDPDVPVAVRPSVPGKNDPSQARELLHAVNMTPVIAGLHRSLLAAKLPAPSVRKVMLGWGMDSAPGFLSELTARNRYNWWSSGDTSDSTEVHGSLMGRKFRGHVRLKAEIDSLQYLGDSGIGTRDDIGSGYNRTAVSKGSSTGGLGGGYNTAGVGNLSAEPAEDPVSGHAADSGGHGDVEDSKGHEKVRATGLVPALGAMLGSHRSGGYSLDAGHLSHTVLNIRGDQSRYHTGLRLVATVESSTHTVAPVDVTTDSELSVPKREAADFVHRTVGPQWTADLRPVNGDVTGPRHKVYTPPRPRRLRSLPSRLPPFRLGMGTTPRGQLFTPDPREPLALASRRGLGFSMPIALPGTEALQSDLRDAIKQHHEKAVGAKKATKSDWATADRDLAMFYGRPALESDTHQALLGVHRRIEVGGRTYKVSAKMKWRHRIEGPNPLTGPVDPVSNPSGDTYEMKVNARVVNGATVTGDRGRATKGHIAFGGGAMLSTPERELNLGALHLRIPPMRIQLGAFRGVFRAAWSKTAKFKSLSKGYRRTETGGKVDEHRYRVTVEWTVTPEAGKPSYIGGRLAAIARIANPQEHAPKVPMTLGEAQRAGNVKVTTAEPPIERSLDFDSGTHGLYPAFHLLPELAQLAARMYAQGNGLPESWLRDPSGWPEEIRDLAHPVILSSRFDDLTGRFGHETELPKDGHHKQAFRIKLHTHAPTDLGSRDDVEVEHYLQGASTQAKDTDRELGLGVDGVVGPQLRFGADASHGEHHGPGGRLTLMGHGETGMTRTSGNSELDGRIDITRATYGGQVHTLRTTPVFEVTYVR